MRRAPVLLILLLLSACAIGDNPPPGGPDLTNSALGATVSPTPGMEPAPTLLEPENNSQIDLAQGVLLAWGWYRDLEPGEIFEILVSGPSGTFGRLSYSQSLVFNASTWFARQSPGAYFWTVHVVQQQAQDGTTRQISLSPPPWALDLPGAVTTPAAGVAALPAITATPMPTVTASPSPLPPAVGYLQQGYRLTLYAKTEMSGITALAFGPEGALYVLDSGGQIARLEDKDGDQFAETRAVVFDDPNNQVDDASGIAFAPANSGIYLAYAGAVSLLTDSDGDGLYDTLTAVIEGPPGLGYPITVNKGLTSGPDGALYLPLGQSGEIYRVSAP